MSGATKWLPDDWGMFRTLSRIVQFRKNGKFSRLDFEETRTPLCLFDPISLERFQVKVFDESAGCMMDSVLCKRPILPRRFEGFAPGVSPVVEAADVASAMLFES